MGDIADYTLDLMEDEIEHEPEDSDYFGGTKEKICRNCQQRALHWENKNGKWRLFEIDGKEHKCKSSAKRVYAPPAETNSSNLCSACGISYDDSSRLSTQLNTVNKRAVKFGRATVGINPVIEVKLSYKWRGNVKEPINLCTKCQHQAILQMNDACNNINTTEEDIPF